MDKSSFAYTCANLREGDDGATRAQEQKVNVHGWEPSGVDSDPVNGVGVVQVPQGVEGGRKHGSDSGLCESTEREVNEDESDRDGGAKRTKDTLAVGAGAREVVSA